MPKWMRGLLALLAVLVAAYLLVRLLPALDRRPPLGLPTSPARLQIAGSAGAVTLEKSGELWNLTAPLHAPADQEAVVQFLASLKSLDLGAVLTERAETHSAYDVDDFKGAKISVFGEGRSLEIIAGKEARDRLHTYVRLPPRPEVYLASGLRRADLDRALPQWRDRRVLPLAAGHEIQSVQVTRDKTSFFLAKSSDGWTVDGRPADFSKTQHFLSSLRTLSARDFVDPPDSQDLKKYGLDRPIQTMKVRSSAGEEFNVKAGRPTSTDPVIYLWREGNVALCQFPAHAWPPLAIAAQELLTQAKN